MRKYLSVLTLATASLALGSTIALSSVQAEEAKKEEASVVEQGKKLSFERKKGNCLACHMIAGGELPGNIGPPLIAMKARFPDKAVLKAQIADARTKNPNTIMPPFGAHGVLSDAEIDKVVEFIHTL